MSSHRAPTRRRFPIAILAAAAPLCLAGLAMAYWAHSGTGSLSLTAATLVPPASVAVPAYSQGTVPVSWSAATPPAGQAISGYYVTRTNGSSAIPACGTSSSSLTAARSCSDTGVPVGSWTYQVVAVFRSWNTVSLPSATVLVDQTAPTATVSFPVAGGDYDTSGWSAGCAASICGTATDNSGGSGVASVAVSIQAPSGNYWSGTGFTSASEVRLAASLGGGSTWSLGFPAGNFPVDGSYTVRAYAADRAGNTQSTPASATFLLDTTPPTQGLALQSGTTGRVYVTGSGNAWTVYVNGTAAGNFVLSDTAADSGSGIAQIAYGSPTGSGWSLSGGTPCSSSPCTSGTFSWTSLPATGAGGVVATDRAGNADTATLSLVPDSTPPAGGSVTANVGSAYNHTGSVPLSVSNFTDSGSGIASNALTRSSTTLAGGSCGTTWSAPVAVTPSGGVDPATLSTGCYRYTLTGIDNVGNTASVASSTVEVDTNAPAFALATGGTAVLASGSTVYFAGSGAGSFTVTASDAATGVTGLSAGALPSGWTAGSVTPAGTGQSVTVTKGAAPVAGTATFTGSTLAGNSGRYSVTLSADTGPTDTAAVASTTGLVVGYMGSGTYYVYANVTPTVPGATVSSATADVANLSSSCAPSCTAVPLVAGTYTVSTSTGGTATYAYRSAVLTPKAGLAAGPASFTVTATDSLGAAGPAASGTVTVETSGPTVTGLASDGDAILQTGDSLTITFSQPVSPASLPATTTVTETGAPGNSGGDTTFAIAGVTNGTLDAGGPGYMPGHSATATFAATLAVNGSTVTVTVGTLQSGTAPTRGTPGVLTFSPATTITDAGGLAASGSYTTPAVFALF